MWLDKYGLPATRNPDTGLLDVYDQLNRCGLIVTAGVLSNQAGELLAKCYWALKSSLQQAPGVFTRYIGGNANTVSADQLISALAAFVALDDIESVENMKRELFNRRGLAQNTHDIYGAKKMPPAGDIMIFRAWPLITRFSSWRFIADSWLIVSVISDFVYMKTQKEPFDVNCILVTLAACERVNPTPLSKEAAVIWRKYGNGLARLRGYHRYEAGGNPEIAEMWTWFFEA